ncbi:SAF domain-containing protein [Clostridium oryzae]|uniref:SAF domain-containing protein n=1 Tax=Clostridium oryzae TaxID=1450648 RepID=A0A1V4IJ83_9CLOT|nr:SAF domain-containing protein [Clostridium oryzae]OPJ59765.1 hypothetical protein CLORY_31100 [Clostridium oryzae]
MFGKKYRTKEDKLIRKFWIGVWIGLLVILIVILVYQFIIIPSVKEDTKRMTLNNVYGKGQNIYVLKKDVNKGQEIDAAFFKNQYTNILTVPMDAIKDLSEIQGKVPRINLSKNTPINSNMFVNMNEYVTEDLRDVDYSDIVLNKDLRKGQYVDIIYRKKDGTNFTVVSKIKVNNVAGQTLYTSMTAKQRQYKDNATVKASLTGGTILTVRYTDAENQRAAKITYPLDKDVEKLINADPKLVKKAGQALRQRNSKKYNVKIKPHFADENK